MGTINEIMGERSDKMHICQMCVNRETCAANVKKEFQNDFRKKYCPSFELRGGRMSKDQANRWTDYMLDRDGGY